MGQTVVVRSPPNALYRAPLPPQLQQRPFFSAVVGESRVFCFSHSASVIWVWVSTLLTGCFWATTFDSSVVAMAWPYQAPPTVLPPCFCFSCARRAFVASRASLNRGFSFLPHGQ